MGAMVVVKPKRFEYVEQTRQALLDAAEESFLAEGYRATSLDAVAAAARFTKGAVYRHFTDKQALFLAVFERVATDAVTGLVPQHSVATDPWRTSLDALAGFLDACSQRRYRRIVLEEGPMVFGWARWRGLDQQLTGHVLHQILEGLMAAGEIDRQPIDPLARLCCAVVGEAALTIADAHQPHDTHAHMLTTLSQMLSGLRHNTGHLQS